MFFRRQRNSRSRTPTCFRPRVEPLEDRLVLAVVAWTGAVDNLWSTAGNWIGGNVPALVDTAVFNAGIAPVVIDPLAPAGVANLDILPSYGGDITLRRNFTVSTELLQLAQDIIVDSTFVLTTPDYTFAGGRIDGNGAVLVSGPGGSGSMLVASNPVFIGVAQVTIDVGSTLTISAPVTLASTELLNRGRTNWIGGDIGAPASTVVNSGLFDIQCDQTFGQVLGAVPGDRFENVGMGQLVKEVTPGQTSFLRVEFINTGFQTWVKSGTLSFSRGTLSSAAPFQIDANATLTFTAPPGLPAPFTLNIGTAFNGSGLLKMTGDAEVASTAGVPLGVSPRLQMEGGSLSGGWNLNGAFTWMGGEIEGPLNVLGSMTILAGSEKKLSNATLKNYGQATWQGDNILMDSSTFDNFGTFEMRTDSKVLNASTLGAQSTFLNDAGPGGLGVLTKTAGDPTRFEVSVNTMGELLLNGLGMSFKFGLTQGGGGITRLAGGTISLDSGQIYTLAGGILFGGGMIDGDLASSGGTVVIGSDMGSLVLEVSGDYTQQANATLDVQARGANAWGELQVNGSASVSGTLALDLLLGYLPPAGVPYDFLLAVGGVGGTFASLPAGYSVVPDVQSLALQRNVLVVLSPTSAWVVSNQGNTAPGQAVTFTATVSGGMLTSPTGTVSFYDGTTLLGTVALTPGMMGATASFTSSGLALGSHQITAVYNGDDTYAGSTSTPLTQTVQQAVTMTWASSSQNYSALGQAVTFTAMVSGMMGGAPTGTVSFYDGDILLGTGTLTPGMMGTTASFTTAGLASGSHQIAAVYSGDDTFLGSTSSPLTQMVGT